MDMAEAYHAGRQGAAHAQVILDVSRRMNHSRKILPVITCEHGGREVPSAYQDLFSGHQAVLDSHSGWDPGALALARRMAGALGVPLHAATTTRLLVELNRSIGHPHLFSEFTRGLPPTQRQKIVQHHYRPHRDAVEGTVARHIAAGYRVIHIASHSFTPVLEGVKRQADVAWLYDPRRAGEKALAAVWMGEFRQRVPALQTRRNYPYRGRDDGLTALLRKRFPDDSYVGIELEVNQRFVLAGGTPWDKLQEALVGSLIAALSQSG